MYQPLLQITDSLWNSMLLSGSETYSASLMFYNSIKNATKSKVQKAETIYNDLSAHLPVTVQKEPSPLGNTGEGSFWEIVKWGFEFQNIDFRVRNQKKLSLRYQKLSFRQKKLPPRYQKLSFR
jgi:hypothetical protein